MKKLGVAYRFSFFIALAVVLSCNPGCNHSDKTLQHGAGQSATAQDKEQQNRNLVDQVVQAAENQENYPDPTYLRGALGRLNSWLADRPESVDFESDAEFAELAASFKTLGENVRKVNELLKLFIDETKTPQESDGLELQQTLESVQKQTEELGEKTTCNALRSYALYFEDLKKSLSNAKEFQFADATETFQTQIREFVKRPSSQYYNCDAFIEGIDDAARLFAIDGKIFLPQDADFVREVVWFRDVFMWAKGDKQDELTIVNNLFDWSVRNIVVTPLMLGPTGPMSQLPWQTLLMSQGSAMDRAIVFMELLRQHRLDSFILRPAGERRNDFPLVVGVRLQNDVYLFLPELGLPIPGEGNDALKLETGLQFGSIATLAQVSQNDALLRRFDLPEKTFSATSKDFEQVVAYVPSTPFTAAARMIPLEQEFSGTVNTVVSTPFESQKQRISSVPGIARVERLYEATAPILEQVIFGFESDNLTQIYMLKSSSGASLEVSDSNSQTNEQIDDYTNSNQKENDVTTDEASASKKPQNVTLWIGKNLYIKGRFTNDNGAGRYFLQGRISERLLKQQEAAVPQRLREYMKQYQELCASQNREASEEELNALASETASAMQMEIAAKRYVKILTSFYLALLSEAAGNDSAALERLNDDSLRIRPGNNLDQNRTYGDEWRYAANYLRARILERQGNVETAVNRLRIDPNNVGDLIRAKWLADLAGIKVETVPASPETVSQPDITDDQKVSSEENSVKDAEQSPESSNVSEDPPGSSVEKADETVEDVKQSDANGATENVEQPVEKSESASENVEQADANADEITEVVQQPTE